jgi:hypothetical protein
MPGEVKISPIGTMAGSLAATATYSSLVTISGTASTVVDLTTDTGGYLLSRGIGKLMGPAAEITTGAVCRLMGRTASSAIQNYSPAVATAVAAVVGVTTSLIVTGSEYIVRGAVAKLQEKYYEHNHIDTSKEAPQQLTFSEDIIKISEIKEEESTS